MSRAEREREMRGELRGEMRGATGSYWELRRAAGRCREGDGIGDGTVQQRRQRGGEGGRQRGQQMAALPCPSLGVAASTAGSR